MQRVDGRIFVIAGLAAIAIALGVYRHRHSAAADTQHAERADVMFSSSAEPTVQRVRSMIDTTAQLLGAPKKYITRRNGTDSNRVVPETSVGIPAAFDELRLMRALTDSLRAGGWSVAASKNLKEKTTTIRFRDRDNTCQYRCILYRKELPLSALKKN